jgi:hypothetical protein
VPSLVPRHLPSAVVRRTRRPRGRSPSDAALAPPRGSEASLHIGNASAACSPVVMQREHLVQLNNGGASRTQQRMLTSNHLRAARALAGWPRADLAKRSSVAVPTITGFELQGADSKVSTLHKLKRALEVAGVEFIDDGHKSDDGQSR